MAGVVIAVAGVIGLFYGIKGLFGKIKEIFGGGRFWPGGSGIGSPQAASG